MAMFLIIIALFLFLPYNVNSITFNFTSFRANEQNLTFEGDAFSNGRELQVTKNQRNVNLTGSIGRASYKDPIRLWDKKTNTLTDFTTHFSFRIEALDNTSYGDGLSFFIAPFDAKMPQNSSGGYLALFSPETAQNSALNQIVAVEFDSARNAAWDPRGDHVVINLISPQNQLGNEGIDVNSIVSARHVVWNSSIKDGRAANAWITYNATTRNLSVFLTYVNNPVFGGNSSLWHVVDLRAVLPERVRVGFSAATGEQAIELHTVVSWEFTSSLVTAEAQNSSTANIGLVLGLVIAICALSFLLGVFVFIRRRKRAKTGGVESGGSDDDDGSMDDEFEKGTGPKKFTLAELTKATNSFSADGKLGEGGFGGVYKGLISISGLEISSGSKQGKKEYASEVRIISRLRHRNLVQLIGWCHEKREFLLVYEYLPNGSLDSHLFGTSKVPLTWAVRYKVALGLASSLLYLHEEWEQCVVHRDIKSSNVMLDSQFNAKLGDFGLARFVDHDLGSQTTVLAGTMGYLAPECVTTGKSSKESDVYSFGVVMLEIACGRKPVELREDPSKVRLVEWVWDLYGKGELLEAADVGLDTEFDEAQIGCLMIVGLWCCHPDPAHRPSIRQVINVLNFEAPFPSLPSKLPVPMYYAPPMDMCNFDYTSSSGFGTDSEKHRMAQSSDNTTNSSLTQSPSMSLLHSQTH